MGVKSEKGRTLWQQIWFVSGAIMTYLCRLSECCITSWAHHILLHWLPQIQTPQVHILLSEVPISPQGVGISLAPLHPHPPPTTHPTSHPSPWNHLRDSSKQNKLPKVLPEVIITNHPTSLRHCLCYPERALVRYQTTLPYCGSLMQRLSAPRWTCVEVIYDTWEGAEG